MSTKTNFKRVALVAVAALGLGVLTSVAPANAAVAAGEIKVSAQSGTVNASACAISATAGAIGGTFVNGSTVELYKTANTDAVYISLTGPAVVVSASGTGATTTSTTFTDGTTAANDKYTIRLTGEGKVTATVSASSSSAAVDVVTITSVKFEIKASFIVYLIRGLPFNSLIFFLGTPLEPPLAGIIPKIFKLLIGLYLSIYYNLLYKI
jgi:hypothetical protein